jgi:inner centromere protein
VSDLCSEDETDDEEHPTKLIPPWAKEPALSEAAQSQFSVMISFTKLFKSSCASKIVLEDIFSTKRRKFVERTSSAMWNTPPVWATSGIAADGEASFMQLRKKNNLQ